MFAPAAGWLLPGELGHGGERHGIPLAAIAAVNLVSLRR